MALPAALLVGAGLGAAVSAAAKILSPAPTKEELKRKELSADTLFVVQPKTALQRTATNVVNSLFF